MRGRRSLVVLVATAALNGCAVAATFRSYDVGPSGLERREQALRELLVRANGDPNLLGAHGRLPQDRLLRALYEGTLAYYGGDYNAAVQRFEVAYRLSEDRYTKSLLRGAGSLLINDRVLEYLPGENERLFIHYYAALAYLRKGEPEEAAVEARRLVYQLQRLDEHATRRDRQARAMLRYFAGAIFEAAGEWNDALVAYRNAALASGDTAGARRETLGAPGNVVLLVEQGFVAHRVNRSIDVVIGRNESRLLARRDDEGHDRGTHGITLRIESSLHSREDDGLFVDGVSDAFRVPAPPEPDAAADPGGEDRPIVGRDAVAGAPPVESVPGPVVNLQVVAEATSVSRPETHATGPGQDAWVREHILDRNAASSHARRGAGRSHDGAAAALEGDASGLRLSLPAFHRPRETPLPRVVIGDAPTPVVISASLSDAIVADFARQRAAVLTRAVARATARYALHRSVEKKAKAKWGSTTGSIVGAVFEASGAALERADTRSWHLLPDRISIIRLQADSAIALRVGGMQARASARDRGRALVLVKPLRDYSGMRSY